MGVKCTKGYLNLGQDVHMGCLACWWPSGRWFPAIDWLKTPALSLRATKRTVVGQELPRSSYKTRHRRAKVDFRFCFISVKKHIPTNRVVEWVVSSPEVYLVPHPPIRRKRIFITDKTSGIPLPDCVALTVVSPLFLNMNLDTFSRNVVVGLWLIANLSVNQQTAAFTIESSRRIPTETTALRNSGLSDWSSRAGDSALRQVQFLASQVAASTAASEGDRRIARNKKSKKWDECQLSVLKKGQWCLDFMYKSAEILHTIVTFWKITDGIWLILQNKASYFVKYLTEIA